MTADHSAPTPEDVESRLRAIDHMSVEDCFLQSPLFERAADTIATLRAAFIEARGLVIEANNSLYGSQGYFHSLNGGPYDKHHLAKGIEDLKSETRRLSRAVAEARAAEREACAKVAESMAPATQDMRSTDIADTCAAIAAAIRSRTDEK